MLPQAIRDAGVIRMATGTTYRPYAYLEGDQWIGHDVDLVNAMAADLGVKVELANVQWASLIPGVQSGRYDILMDGMGDIAAREEVIDFVNYFRVHEALVVPKGNPKGISSTNYCGFTFAENVGSLEIGYIEELGNRCKEEGKPPTVLLAQKTTPEGFVAIEAGRADAMLTPAPPAVAAAQLNPDKWEALTDVFEGFSFSNGLLLGIGTQKGATDLQNALVWALDRQIQSGFYAENMKKYGMPENGAIEKATVNAGPASMAGGG